MSTLLLLFREKIKDMSITDNISNRLEALSSPAARGERLKKLRNLANADREELCNVEGLNANTFKGWELGRYGGLTKEGAERVIDRIANENVICSKEWLLYGIGIEPIVITNNNNIHVSDSMIAKELVLFQAFVGEILYLEINDVSPFNEYQMGDIIAGIKITADNFRMLVGSIVLVENTHHEVRLRKILKTVSNNRFLLSSFNNQAAVEEELISAARISRHYKPN